MEDRKRTFGEAVGQFVTDHPWMTFFTVASLIEAPATIIKALKWDGHYASTSPVTVSVDDSDDEESTEVEESE